MKQKLHKILLAVLALVFLGSLGMVIVQSYQSKQARQAYDEAAQLARQTPVQELEPLPEVPLAQLPAPDPVPTPEPTPEPEPVELPWQEAPVEGDANMDTLAQTDLAALKGVNEDVLAWIEIPGTGIAYPVMQGEDNDFYLNHTWKKEANSGGSIFMEQWNTSDFTDYNTIIYGHRRKNGTMFAPLRFFNEEEHWRAHPYIYIVDDNGVHRYEIFAAYEAPVKSVVYRLSFDEEAKQELLDFALEHSVIDTGVVPHISDRILTLSTCTGNGHTHRWVVQARLKALIPES